MTSQVEQSTIKLLFPILTPSPNKASCFVVSYRKLEQRHKTHFGGGGGKACLRAEEKHEQSLANFDAD